MSCEGSLVWSACLFRSHGRWTREAATVRRRLLLWFVRSAFCPPKHLALIYHQLVQYHCRRLEGVEKKKGAEVACVCLYLLYIVSTTAFCPYWILAASLSILFLTLYKAIALLPSWINRLLHFFPLSFADSHPQSNGDSRFRKCLDETAVHSRTDMWVLYFWNSARCTSTPCYFWNSCW